MAGGYRPRARRRSASRVRPPVRRAVYYRVRIVESFVRNSADAVYEAFAHDAGWDLSRLFWWLLTGFTVWGVVVILLFSSPLDTRGPFVLLVVGAALSGVMMWPYTVLTLLVNTARLPELQPGWGRVVAM